MSDKLIVVEAAKQLMLCYEQDTLYRMYPISTAKNGLGERKDSECTPRGWHTVHSVIGKGYPLNSVFVGRCWTKEIYSSALAKEYPQRDWILTRIIRLDGLEPGRNKGNDVDTLARYIYIHGTPDSVVLGLPGSHGCIRMRNKDIVALAEWVDVGQNVCIE